VAVSALAQQGRDIVKLWILKPVNEYRPPWTPQHDKAFGFVVRAETEPEAREFAKEVAGYEGAAAWNDPEYSTCIELTPDGESEVIMIDFHYA
jgi:hypothetical protein